MIFPTEPIYTRFTLHLPCWLENHFQFGNRRRMSRNNTLLAFTTTACESSQRWVNSLINSRRPAHMPTCALRRVDKKIPSLTHSISDGRASEATVSRRNAAGLRAFGASPTMREAQGDRWRHCFPRPCRELATLGIVSSDIDLRRRLGCDPSSVAKQTLNR